MQCLHICNPENRRAAFFREACQSLGLPPPRELPWVEALAGFSTHSWREADLIRIESPGENVAVERLLIERGGGPLGLPPDPARIRHQPEWYRGWVSVLEELFRAAGKIPCMNSPGDIALMFDKWKAQRALSDSGVPIPQPLGRVRSYDELEALMDESGVDQVFLKPCHSSSASGVVALRRSVRLGQIVAVTSAAMLREGVLYNSLRLRRYRDFDSVRALINTLADENLMVERWFPKASLGKKTFDLRVLVIAGEARHVVARTSETPITNLHLGNARGDIAAVRSLLGEGRWREGMTICESAAACFPQSLYVAVDLMPSSSLGHFAVAEVNAFGDLLPGIRSRGNDTYTAQLRAILEADWMPSDGGDGSDTNGARLS